MEKEVVCEVLNTLMQEIFWRAWIHSLGELFPVAAFLILFYKAFRKDSMSFWLKVFLL